MLKQDSTFRVFLLQHQSCLLRTVLLLHFPNFLIQEMTSPKEALACADVQPNLLIIVLDEAVDLSSDFVSNWQIISPSTAIIFIGEVFPLQRITSFIRLGALEYLDINTNYQENLILFIQQYFHSFLEGKKKRNSLVEQFRTLGVIGSSSLSRRLYKKILKAAAVDTSLLILGESGVGKEHIAKTIHSLSNRREAHLEIMDCLGWPPDLLEQQLFGQEKNVFMGILKRKLGKIELASGGTLVLDNPQALPLNIQDKLLRALVEQKFIRPGGGNIVFFNARLIVLSSTDLKRVMKTGLLRKDLYYQLLTYSIQIPALRKRPSDIPVLANFFLRQFIRRNKLKSLIFTKAAKDKLMNYSFPGNIRELQTVVEVSALGAEHTEIGEKNILIPDLQPFPLENWLDRELSMEEITQEAIHFYLDKFNGNIIKAAKALGIGKSTIYRYLKSENK